MDPNKTKESFDKSAKEGGGDYERSRWFQNDIQEINYATTKTTVEDHFLNSLKLFENYFELGPGPGTWTKFFIEKCPQANFDLVDISGVMLEQAKAGLGVNQNVRYIQADFSNFQPEKHYDLFFSSRAFEYLSDKKEAVVKIAGLLKNGGRGFIITKTPKYLRIKLLGRKVLELHAGQIAPEEFKKLLVESGFKNIEIYPATMNFPLLRSPRINQLLFKMFCRHQLNIVSQFFSESYAIKFEK